MLSTITTVSEVNIRRRAVRRKRKPAASAVYVLPPRLEPTVLAGQFGTRRFSTSKKLMTRMSGNYTTAIKDSGQLTTTCDKTTENRGRMPVGPEGRIFVIRMPMIPSTGSIRNSVP